MPIGLVLQQVVRLKDRAVQCLEKADVHRSPHRQGEFQRVNQHVDPPAGFVPKIGFNCRIHAGAVLNRIRRPMAEYGNYVQPALAQRVNQNLLVRQIAPDPFLAGYQQANCQSSLLQSSLTLKFRQCRDAVVTLRIQNAAPRKFGRFSRFFIATAEMARQPSP